jgi:hypothetical protein
MQLRPLKLAALRTARTADAAHLLDSPSMTGPPVPVLAANGSGR